MGWYSVRIPTSARDSHMCEALQAVMRLNTADWERAYGRWPGRQDANPISIA